VVSATPALRGYPGGPGLGLGDDEPANHHVRETRGLSTPSVWQQAQKAWRESGIEWQRPAGDWEPAEAEWERVQAMPASKQRGAGVQARTHSPGAKLTGRMPARTLGGLSSTALPGSSRAGGPLARTGTGRPVAVPGGGGGRRSRPSRRFWLTVLVVIVVAALVVAGLFAFGPLRAKPHHKAATPPFPAAAAASADFATSPAQAARGIFQSVSSVAAYGGTVVAVGYESGQWIPRAQFLVSTDGGRTWRLAPVSTASGAAPAPTARPQLVAGGPGGWLAVGTGTTWTSRNGTAWTITNDGGIAPLRPGDQVVALARTSTDFVAVGHNGHSPVVWTSSSGQIWQRLGVARLHLAGSRQTVLDLRGVAAHGGDVIVDGAVTTRSRGRRPSTSDSVGIWRSTDGGSTWAAANPPVTGGATPWVDGIAATGSGFVAIRPSRSGKAGSGAVVYGSADGRSWTRTATLTAGKRAGLHFGKVGGSDQGAAAVGQLANGSRIAFVSTDGSTWHRVPGVGGPAQSPAQVTVTTNGTAVVGGSATPSAVQQRPYLVVAGPGGHATPVSFGAAAQPALGVYGIAATTGGQVAVGSANGYPAIWSATPRNWAQVSSAALSTQGLGALTGVAHGGAGWVAVGGVVAGAPSRPLILTSADGTSWQSVASESAFAGQGITVRQVVAGPSGYVIIGSQVIPAHTVTTKTVTRRGKRTSRKTVPARTVAALWWSSGLTGWTRADGQLAGSGHPQMNAVTAGGPGYLAAGANGSTPAVWASADGQQWTLTQAGPPPGATSAALLNVAAHGKVIVATGMATTASGAAPFAEYSVDGGTLWQPVKLAASGGPAAVTALAATGKRGFVAVGTVGPPGNQRVVFWTSANGSGWQVHEPAGAGLNGPGTHQITALTTTRSGLLGVGFTATPLAEQPILWTGTAGQAVSANR
jgi:hypothetical protein